MAESFVTKQLRPAAGVTTALHTVSGGAVLLTSTIAVANDDTAQARYRITIAIGAAADAPVQRIAPDVLLPANAADGYTIGGTLNAGDEVRVRSDTGNVNFHLFGIERT